MATTQRQLEPIRSDALVSVIDLVTRSVRDAILEGRLLPGARLLQDALAAQLRVSRQPVREALRRLESEGLVVSAPRRGITVRGHDPSEIKENYHLRALLEPEACRLACERITPDDVRRLRQLNQAMAGAVASGGGSPVIDANAQFHRLIHRGAKMPALERLIGQLWIGHTVLTPLFIPGRSRRSIEEHEAVIRALEERNPERAADAMRIHITTAAQEFLAHLSSRAEPGAVEAPAPRPMNGS